jgi:hypothetical protein
LVRDHDQIHDDVVHELRRRARERRPVSRGVRVSAFPTSLKEQAMPSTTTKDEHSVDDTVEEKTPEENAQVVKQATGTGSTKKDDPPKDKAPTTAEVAGAWIRAQLEDDPKTKAQLIELAAKTNPAKFENPKGKDKAKVPRSTKWIVEHGKVGEMIPGNAGGHYISEGLDSARNGGIRFVFADEKAKTLKVE